MHTTRSLLSVILLVTLSSNAILCSNSQSSPVVLTFRPEETSSPRARILTTVSPLQKFSLCYWYRPLGISTKYNAILDYEVPSVKINELVVYVRLGNNRVYLVSGNPSAQQISISYPIPLLKWQHMCFVWSSYTGTVFLYMNGQLAGNATNFKKGQTFLSGGELFMGADQGAYGNNKFPNAYNAFGEVTEFHLWDKRICASQIRKLASCNSTIQGNIVAWGKTKMIPMNGTEIGSDPDVCDQCSHPEYNVDIPNVATP